MCTVVSKYSKNFLTFSAQNAVTLRRFFCLSNTFQSERAIARQAVVSLSVQICVSAFSVGIRRLRSLCESKQKIDV